MASILSKKKKKKKKKKNKREKYSISELKTLGHQLLSSRAHINNLPLLMSFVCSGTSPPYYALEALLSVQSFFTPILPDLPSHPQGDPQDPEFIYRTWLRSKFDDFVNSLIDIAVSPQSKEALRELVLEMGEGFTPLYTTGLFTAFYFTYITIEKLARTLGAKDISDNKIVSVDGNNKSHSRTSVELPIHKIYRILSHIPPLEGTDEKAEHEMWNGSGVFIKEGDHKEHSQHPKADDKQNKVLVTLHQAVIPYLSNPIMLCDFLTRSYDIGGVISVMALSSLYILMTQHGLEYPNFYEKLFALLVPSIFMAKHRAKFFELLDSCLKSPLLPAYLAAAFAKKLSRLSLSVPPSGALVIIALIHNLLRRHPSINCLVHRENGDGTSRDNSRVEDGETEDSCTKPEISTEPEISSKKSGIDHFNNEESNPVKTDAMRSSLWEIDTLRHHYCPPVSRFVLSLENDLTVRSKTTEVAVKDFSSGSYATIFRAEIGRRVKQVPLAFYKATPSSLFSESDFVGWTFKYKENDELFTSGVDNKNIDISEDHGHGSAKRQRIECS
ncbi:hypothetical protein CsSME_00043278 [Camellia sinensis var. sinensis]